MYIFFNMTCLIIELRTLIKCIYVFGLVLITYQNYHIFVDCLIIASHLNLPDVFDSICLASDLAQDILTNDKVLTQVFSVKIYRQWWMIVFP